MSLDARVALRLGDLALDVTLRVADGEVVAILGPNGAGKTTLLRALAGLLPIADGHVRLGGRELDALAPEHRAVGVMFQDYLLFPHLTAVDNVAFGLRARGVPKAEARARAHDWLTRMRLADRAHAKPRALSGGQAQRVALARALAIEPELLLLDEPLAALDVDARQAVRRQLREHLDGFAGPSLVVTHQPLEAMALANRLVILEDGRVVQDGPVEEVTRRPRSEWVARLVGLNLLRGRAVAERVELASGAALVVVPGPQGDVFAIVHPRAVALHRARPDGSPRNVWAGAVGGLDVVGDRVRVHVDGTVPVVAEVTPAAVTALDLAGGGQVWVSVKATEIDLYPV